MKSILSSGNTRSYNVKAFVTFMLFTLIFISCDTTDYVNDLGSVISPVDQAKYQKILHTSISDTAVRVQTEWGISRRLLAGTFVENYETMSVLKFNDFTDLPDTAKDNISDIILEFTLSNTIGDSSTGTIDLFLYKNSVDWEEDNLKSKSFNDFIPSSVDLIDSTTVTWGLFDSVSNKITFEIPIELAESWMASSATNGVILTASPSGFIASFHSRYSSVISLLPVLEITYKVEEDSSTTARIIASADGYVLNILSDLPDSEPDKILIGGGAAYRSMVMIDSSMINSIPVNASIVDANLTLTIDRQGSLLPFSNSAVNGIGISLLFSFVKSTEGTDSLFVIDKTDFDLVAIPIDGDEMTLDLTGIIQQWVAGTRENLGIALGSNSESSQIFRISLYGQNSSVSESMKPNIDIYYVNSPEDSD
ncbi:MAG: hypothetical protein IH880_09480 [Candidatus Marinimicrobia bacterium]|nr:hypothetical protein [Candidatus Neomarinimicrobiota bacterium]